MTQSVETIEKKGFVFFERAKKCRVVRKEQEVKEIDEVKEIKKPGAARRTGRLERDLSRRLLWVEWGREFTTHDTIYYLLCQFYN